MAKKKTKTVYNVSYYSLTNKLIDQTQVDEKDDQLAWDLFKEFGHTRKEGDYLDWEDDEEEVDDEEE